MIKENLNLNRTENNWREPVRCLRRHKIENNENVREHRRNTKQNKTVQLQAK